MYYVSRFIQSYVMMDLEYGMYMKTIWYLYITYDIIFIIFLSQPAKYVCVFSFALQGLPEDTFIQGSQEQGAIPSEDISGWLSAACAHEQYWMRSGLFQLVLSTPAGGSRWDMERGKVRIQLHL